MGKILGRLLGKSLVDESMLTGESMPAQKGPGATVIGATINKSGSFRYKATKIGGRHGAGANRKTASLTRQRRQERLKLQPN